jgi:hypothetical protein
MRRWGAGTRDWSTGRWTWRGFGPQYLPARVIGPIPRHLDATGILLEMVTAGS